MWSLMGNVRFTVALFLLITGLLEPIEGSPELTSSVTFRRYAVGSVVRANATASSDVASQLDCATRCLNAVTCVGYRFSPGEGATLTGSCATLLASGPGGNDVRVDLLNSFWKDTGAVEVEVYGEGANSHPEDYGITWYEHDFPRSGMFVLNHVLVRVAYGRGLNVLAVNPRTLEYEFRNFDMYGGTFGNPSALDAEAALRDFLSSLPVPSLVLVAVYDSAECWTDCQVALASIGGSGNEIGFRESFALIGHRGACVPTWVTETRHVHNNNTAISTLAVAKATVTKYCDTKR